MRYKYLLLLLALLALNTPISAEYFRHIGLSEGLTQPSVMSIHQDQLGRMWFGTREGINLYDGKQITAFKGWCNASNDSAPIWLGNEVSSIVEDKQGNIFFLVDDDIIKFDIQTEQFSRLSKGSRIPVLTSLEGDLWYMRRDSLFKHSSGATESTKKEKSGKCLSAPVPPQESAAGKFVILWKTANGTSGLEHLTDYINIVRKQDSIPLSKSPNT